MKSESPMIWPSKVDAFFVKATVRVVEFLSRICLRRANVRLVSGHGSAEATFGEKKPKFSTHSFGCHFVEVTWQPEIARLRVNRVVTVIDAGRIINPLAGRNQNRRRGGNGNRHGAAGAHDL